MAGEIPAQKHDLEDQEARALVGVLGLLLHNDSIKGESALRIAANAALSVVDELGKTRANGQGATDETALDQLAEDGFVDDIQRVIGRSFEPSKAASKTLRDRFVNVLIYTPPEEESEFTE